MAIAFNAVSTVTSTTAESSFSVNHTAAGSNRLAVVIVHLMRTSDAGIEVASATYGGNTMTERATQVKTDSSSNRSYRVSIYTYLSPPTSSTTVAVTSNVNSAATAISVMTFTGVDLTTPYDANATAAINNSSAPTVNVATTVANAWLVGGTHLRGGDTQPMTPDTGVDERYDVASGSNNTTDIGAAGGSRATTTAGSYTFAFTAASSDDGVIAAIAIRPASESLSITPSGIASSESVGSAAVDVLTAATIAVTTSGDDGEEGDSGTVNLSANYITASSQNPVVGVLFRNVPLPQGNTVSASHVRLKLNSTLRDSPGLTIRAEGNPADFAETSNNLSGRATTTEAVIWSVNDIGTGWKTSPDISAVLQEIVNDESWVAGGDIALYLIDNGTGGDLSFHAFDSSTADGAVLYVDWTTTLAIAPSGIASAQSVGAAVVTRGPVNIVPGSITSAQNFGSAVTAAGSVNVQPTAVASGESVPSPVMTSGGVLVVPMTMSSAESVAEPTVVAGGILAGNIVSGEAFGLPTLTPGAVSVLSGGIVSGENVNGVAITTGPTAVLPAGISGAEAFGSPALSGNRTVITLSGGNNDALEGSDGFIYLATTSGNVDAGSPYAAFYWANLPVPAEATIVHAYLRLYTFTYGNPNLTAKAQVSVSPAVLSTAVNDISNRTLSENGVIWSETNIGLNRYNDSPDLAAVVQEIIELPGYTGNASDLLLVLHDNGAGGQFRFNMTDSPTDRPQLVIDYVVGETLQTITVPAIGSGESISTATVVPSKTDVAISEGVPSAETVNEPSSIIVNQFIQDAGEIATAFRLVDVAIENEGLVTISDGIASLESVNMPSLAGDSSVVVTDSITSGESASIPSVLIGAVYIAPEGIASLEAVDVSLLTTWVAVLTDSITSAESAGATTIIPGAIHVVALGIESVESLPVGLVTVGTRIVSPDGITSLEAIGLSLLSSGAVNIAPAVIGSSETIGTVTVEPAAVTVRPSGVVSAENVGEVVVNPGAADIAPESATALESFGGAILSPLFGISPDGIISAEGVVSPTVEPGDVVVWPTGIDGAESFGGTVMGTGVVHVLPAAIASLETFGGVVIVVGAANVTTESIASGEAFGLLLLTARFLPTVNIWRVPEKSRVYRPETNRVYAVPFKVRIYRMEE